MRLYIMRHGETEWNVRRLYQGHSDIPLNENGVALAEITGPAASGTSPLTWPSLPPCAGPARRRRSSSGAGTSLWPRSPSSSRSPSASTRAAPPSPQSGTLIRTPISSTSSGTRSTTWPPRAASPSRSVYADERVPEQPDPPPGLQDKTILRPPRRRHLRHCSTPSTARGGLLARGVPYNCSYAIVDVIDGEPELVAENQICYAPA